MIKRILLAPMILTSAAALGATGPTVSYLANEGVMFSDGETKVLFDPLFNNSYGEYQLVSEEVREQIFEGLPPYDGVDAVFVSHHHGDHFDPKDMVHLLNEQSGVRLYAPAQAVSAMREIADANDSSIFDRVVEVNLQYGDEPLIVEAGRLTIEMANVPHAGWPEYNSGIQNIAFRVTIDGEGTVLHLGDAGALETHFEQHARFWTQRRADIALPPFWFFLSEAGREILDTSIDVGHSVGIHVPAALSDPDEIPDELQGFDLFTQPGEQREIDRENSQEEN